jgi:erythromycin esterase-like protein
MKTLTPEEALERALARARDAQFVLIGEASHGTHEFYELRAELTKQLIEEVGFCGVAVEADWPDAYRANWYARGVGGDRDADEALAGFRRFPTWMWRNTVVLEFLEWLRERNRHAERGAGWSFCKLLLQEKPRFARLLQSPLADSNRRPPVV